MSKKNKHKKKASTVSSSSESNDQEVSIDFSKYVASFKKIFSNSKSSKKTKTEVVSDVSNGSSSDEISLDVKSVITFFKKYGLFFLILIPIILSLTIRMQTSYLPITHDWAIDSVHQNVRASITNAVNQQYPNLPAVNKNKIIQEQFDVFLEQNKQQIDDQINQLATYFRDQFQDESGNTYMPDIDPYHFMRFARNYVETGQVHDKVDDNGNRWDDHMIAPVGRPYEHTMHPYVLAYIYKAFSFFKPNISLMRASSYFPIIFTVLSIIPLFFLSRKASGNFGALVTTVAFSINIAFLNRSLWGHADTDSYNLFFPILITWLFFESISFDSSKIRRGIFSGFTGLAVGLYSLFWLGWWYIFNFMVATLIALVIYYAFSKKIETLKKTLYSTGFILLTACIFTSLFVGFNVFISSVTFAESLSFTKIKDVGLASIWPNVMTTVAELNEVDLNGIIHNITIGSESKLVFFTALVGLIFIMMRGKTESNKKYYNVFMWGSIAWYVILMMMQPSINSNIFMFMFLMGVPIGVGVLLFMLNKDENNYLKYSVFLLIWFAGTMYASTKGIRFVMLMVPAFSVAFGSTFGYLYDYFSTTISKWVHLKGYIIKILFVAFTAFVLFSPIQAAYQLGKHDVPSVNDAWFNSLDKIKQESDPGAIVTSWWDFGHWFKWYTDRAVTFDGASQLGGLAHMVGKTLSTGDEELAVGILRMLHCGSEGAFNYLFPLFGDHAITMDAIYEILVLDKEEAKTVLVEKYGLNEEDVLVALEKTHCTPPEAYFIASGDMIGKSGVWGHFGSWDFHKAQMFLNVKGSETMADGIDFLKETYNKSDTEAQALYYEIKQANGDQWIAGWPSYVSGLNGCSALREDMVLECPNNLGGNPMVAEINLITGDAALKVGGKTVKLASFGIVTPEGIKTKTYENPDFPYSMLLIPNEDGNGFSSLFMFPELLEGTFTKMYFLKGHSLKYFDLFSYQKDVTGLEIFVYKVDWSGESANVVYSTVEDEEETVVVEDSDFVESTDVVGTQVDDVEASAESEEIEVSKDSSETIEDDLENKE